VNGPHAGFPRPYSRRSPVPTLRITAPARSTARGGNVNRSSPKICTGMPAISREVIGGGVRTAIATRAAPSSTRSAAISAPVFPSPTTRTRFPANSRPERNSSEWKSRPSNASAPGQSGSRRSLCRPVARTTARVRHSPSPPSTTQPASSRRTRATPETWYLPHPAPDGLAEGGGAVLEHGGVLPARQRGTGRPAYSAAQAQWNAPTSVRVREHGARLRTVDSSSSGP
jgi:hypothetical protein